MLCILRLHVTDKMTPIRETQYRIRCECGKFFGVSCQTFCTCILKIRFKFMRQIVLLMLPLLYPTALFFVCACVFCCCYFWLWKHTVDNMCRESKMSNVNELCCLTLSAFTIFFIVPINFLNYAWTWIIAKVRNDGASKGILEMKQNEVQSKGNLHSGWNAYHWHNREERVGYGKSMRMVR